MSAEHDTLLEWASELGSGSWQQWRQACATLELEPTETMQNLAALGHVEMDWAADRFCCAPPTAAFLHRSSGCVLLTGARPRGLLDDLEAFGNADSELDFFIHEPVGQQRGPSTVLVEVELDDLPEICQAAGLQAAYDPSGALAAALPAISLESAASAESQPPRPEVPRRRFDPDRMTLRVVADPHDETGLWWYDGYRRAEAWIARSDGWWHVPIREYAPYLAFGDRALLRYDNAHGRLVVFQRAPLPPLHARVATLASGRLPRPAGTAGPPSWSYENIDPQLAHQLAHSLASSLEIL